MADPSVRAAAIEGFAARLRELRSAAGNPSFREMAGRSRAISHTTLHEAAQGHRLPSWPTVKEFVESCGGDPADYREPWADADRAVRGQAAGPPDAEIVTPVPKRQRRKLLLALAGATAALAVVVLVLVLALTGGDGPSPKPAAAATPSSTPSSGTPSPTKVFTAADCPVKQTQPPLQPALHRGDKADFIGDITVPDCSEVPRAGTFTKIWRLKNVGSVRWNGYAMQRMDDVDRDKCQTIREVPIPDTAPGREVDVTVQVTAPARAGFCYARYRIVDADGRPAFPSGRPINFQVIVD